MKFVYPEFLYALFAIAIPIVIHLFNFRKFKKIYFSNVQFLREVTQETQSKSKLKHLLVLLARIFAISFLVFAFAQPYFPTENQLSTPKDKVVGIYLDNSFSMESTGELGALLDEAKLKATEVVKEYNASDKFLVITNEFTPGDNRLLSKEQAIEQIEQTQIVPSTRNLSAIYNRATQNMVASGAANKHFYYFSDFQKSVSDFTALEPDTTINWFLVPLAANLNGNLFVDTCWFESPSHLYQQQEELKAIIVNQSDKDLENIPVKLFINNQLITPTTVSVKANDNATVAFSYSNKQQGTQQGKIEVQDFPVVTDDIFYFTYEIAEKINVLEIKEQQNENIALAALFKSDSLFNFQSYAVEQLDYSQLKTTNLIVLNELSSINSGLIQTLQNFVENGGSLMIFPALNIERESYTLLANTLGINPFTALDTTSLKVRDINYDHPIFKNVFEQQPDTKIDLPKVNQHHQLAEFNTPFKSNVLTLNNGHPFLVNYKVGKGQVYLSTSGLAKSMSGFAHHAIFVPVMYNAALYSQTNYPNFFTIGNSNALNINSKVGENVFYIKNESIEIIPKTKGEQNHVTVFMGNEITTAGHYSLSGSDIKIGLAFNYNRNESDLTCYSVEELNNLLTEQQITAQVVDAGEISFKSAINELQTGEKYWRICLILALFFLATEIALIRWWK